MHRRGNPTYTNCIEGDTPPGGHFYVGKLKKSFRKIKIK
jgi:hypothetical protein